MPYKTNKDLPDQVRDNLPEHAQDIFRETFNSAEEQYKDPDKRKLGGTLEETAFAVAWAAVKEKYEKNEKSGEWKTKNS